MSFFQKVRDRFFPGVSRKSQAKRAQVRLSPAHKALVTPKWARKAMRNENSFRRAMDRSELPVLKAYHVAEFCRRGVPAEALAKVHANHQELAVLVWERSKLFSRKRSTRQEKRLRRVIAHNAQLPITLPSEVV